jgi:putative spermidine/putrescine transport system substrate-binding protein
MWFRSKFLQAATVVTLLGAGALNPATAQVKEIVIVHSGGKYGESLEACCIVPFTQKTGIKVISETPGGFGKLRAMVESKNVRAVLYDLAGTGVEQARALNLIEPMDWNAIAPEGMYPEGRLPDAFGTQYYSTIMAWRSGAKAPKTWQDFWNVKDFPGKRSLPNYPYHILAIALLADGVPADKLYPLDLDRAFASLAKIKDHVSVWWQAGAQPTQLLKDNEVQYAAVWSGRAVGEPGVEYTYNHGVLNLSFFVVPKGADPAAKAAAMKLLHEMSVAKNQAVAATIVPYTGTNPALSALLPKDKLHEFPTSAENKAVQSLPDLQWWGTNSEQVERRWQAFKLTQ